MSTLELEYLKQQGYLNNQNQSEEVIDFIGIDSQSPKELKSYAHPPEIVKRAIQYVQILLDPSYKPSKDSWNSSKAMLHDNFSSKLRNFDVDSVSDKQIQLIQSANEIQMSELEAISYAAADLFAFVKFVQKTVETKRYQEKRKLRSQEEKISNLQYQIKSLSKIKR